MFSSCPATRVACATALSLFPFAGALAESPDGYRTVPAYSRSADLPLELPAPYRGAGQPSASPDPRAIEKVWIVSVESQYGGAETIREDQTRTSNDHYGLYLKVGVLEVGIAAQRRLTLDGVALNVAPMYTFPVCIIDGQYSWPCSSGTVVGTFLQYDLGDSDGGQFRHESIPAEGPSRSDSLEIL